MFLIRSFSRIDLAVFRGDCVGGLSANPTDTGRARAGEAEAVIPRTLILFCDETYAPLSCRYRRRRMGEQFYRTCEGFSDTCRGEVVAVLGVDRQVSEKPQGRKPRAASGSVVGSVGSMGN